MLPTWSGESTWMTPMTESRFQRGAHIADRICCIRMDSPASNRTSAWASDVSTATFWRTTMSTIVREYGAIRRVVIRRWPDLKRLIRRSFRAPRSSRSRKPRSTGRYSKMRSMTLSRTVSRSSAEISVLATCTRISKTLFL